MLGRIEFTVELDDIADADLVIEAVPEDVELKTQCCPTWPQVVARRRSWSPRTPRRSRSPSSPPRVPHPERVLGLHFFSPVPVMGLVEIVVALDTERRRPSRARERSCERSASTPIETKDRSGFIVNMLLVPYLMAAVRMYEEGFATARTSTRA